MARHDNVTKEIENLYGIKLSDLETLPFKTLHWKCLCPTCNRGTFVRDYGIAPYYFSARKGWGWVDGSQWWMMCGHHWKQKHRVQELVQHRMSEQYLLEHFRETNKTQKLKPFGVKANHT